MASHEAVAERWAKRGRPIKGFNMFIIGDAVYSHGTHFIIAQWHKTPAGEDVVLFNNFTYSSTTGRHMSYTRSAIPTGTLVFEVDRPNAVSKGDHLANYRSMVLAAEALAVDFMRRRKHLLEHYAGIEGAVEHLNAYAKTFKLGRRTMIVEKLRGGQSARAKVAPVRLKREQEMADA